MNASSLCNILSELHLILNSGSHDLLFFNEIWFHEGLSDSVILNETDYSIQRHDRTYGFGGGTCIFIKNKFVDYLRVDIPEKYSYLDIVCIDLIGLETNYRFINCYRPPYHDRNAFDLTLNGSLGCKLHPTAVCMATIVLQINLQQSSSRTLLRHHFYIRSCIK